MAKAHIVRWPWITGLIAALILLNPFSFDLINAAFFSNEALSRNIAQPLLMMVLGVLALLIACEWLIRMLLARRRARKLGAQETSLH